MPTELIRINRSKSHTGCKTCKIRRVKCGEEKPACLRCSSTGRKCDFETESYIRRATDLIISCRPSPLSTSLARLNEFYALNTGSDERFAFEFYFERAALAVAGVLDVDFWRGLVVQLCRTEPAIWDAIIAIGSLYWNQYQAKGSFIPLFSGDTVYPGVVYGQYSQAVRWYSRSMANVRAQISRDSIGIDVALVSCTLFILIEILQGNKAEAYKLYCQGINLISTLCTHHSSPVIRIGRTTSNPFGVDMLPLYHRLGLSFFSLMGDSYDLIVRYREDPSSFETLGDARIALYEAIDDCLSFELSARSQVRETNNSISDIEITAKQAGLLRRLEKWYTAFTRSFRRRESAGDSILLMLYASFYITTATCLSNTETIYDEHIELFKEIVRCGTVLLERAKSPKGPTSPISTFEMGSGIALYHTITRCRNSVVRRQALRIFLEVPVVQAWVGCVPGAMLGAKVIELEEQKQCHDGKVDNNSQGFIEESCRIKGIRIFQRRQDDGSTNVYVCLVRNRWEDSKKIWGRFEEETLLYSGHSALESQKLLLDMGKQVIDKVLGPDSNEVIRM